MNDRVGWLSVGPIPGRDVQDSDIPLKAETVEYTRKLYMTAGSPLKASMLRDIESGAAKAREAAAG
jgi:hypothetical protein